MFLLALTLPPIILEVPIFEAPMLLRLIAVEGRVLYCFSSLVRSIFCWFSSSFFTFWYLCNNLKHLKAKILLIVFIFSLLESLIHVSFNLLSECIHLILLFLNKFSFSSDDFLVSLLKIFLSFIFFHLLCLNLHLMSISILLLSGQLLLDSSKVE